MNDNTQKKPFNVAAVIGKLRRLEVKIKEIEVRHEEELAEYKKMSLAGRNALLDYLNETGQRSAATAEGGCHKRTKISYRVSDRELFKKHVIDHKSWEMLVWRANDSICEDYAIAHKAEPPGTARNAVDILTVTAPTKPKLRKMKPASVTETEWQDIEDTNDPESNPENGE